ncbi:MAG: hypothetical protein WCJ40_11150 [Planctomycetota bacterium]|jgi:hypothetical protein|nr:hypothetical protein [Planctomycetota bacterium]
MIRLFRASKAVCAVLVFAVFLGSLHGCGGSSSTPKTYSGGGPIPEFTGDEGTTKTKSKTAKKK